MRFFTALLTVGLTAFSSNPVLASNTNLSESPDKDSIYIAHPRDGTKVAASKTFVVGAAAPGKDVLVNGTPARKNAQGFFAHVVPLKRGTNPITVSLADKSVPDKTVNVIQPIPPATLSASLMAIADVSLEPRTDIGVSAGDLVILKARGTPGGSMTAKIDNALIQLSPAPEVRQSREKHRSAKKKTANKPAVKTVTPEVNEGLAHAYGKVFQSLPAGADDLYVGFYKIQPGDKFSSARIRYTLKKDGKSLSSLAAGAVTVITQPHLVQTNHDDTIVRVNPDKARLTPLPKGVRLMVDGWQGDNIRCLYGPGLHVYLKQEDISYERGSPKGSGPIPKSFVSSVNISRSTYGDAVVVPLNQRLPFHIEQTLNPNKLVVKIYGATSDTDYASQEYNKAFEEGEEASSTGSISRNASEAGMIDGVAWKQALDDVYELTVKVRGSKQWGFAGTYQGNNLVIHVKNPPSVRSQNNQGLLGLNICIDPGHGGAAPGSTGCSGVTEAQLNLAISMKLKKLLEAEGARVIMTRTTDVDLDLYERCKIASNAMVDVLLSVHNNSLPDGRDPWKEHGSSTYFYHPQAIELARQLKDSLVRDLGFPDIGARYQNLALTRPSNQLSVLAEIGFMIHPDEYAQLIRPEVQDKIAQSLAAGLKRYFDSSNNTQ